MYRLWGGEKPGSSEEQKEELREEPGPYSRGLCCALTHSLQLLQVLDLVVSQLCHQEESHGLAVQEAATCHSSPCRSQASTAAVGTW